MMSKRTGLYDDEMKIMEGVNYAYKLTSPISESARQKTLNIIFNTVYSRAVGN